MWMMVVAATVVVLWRLWLTVVVRGRGSYIGCVVIWCCRVEGEEERYRRQLMRMLTVAATVVVLRQLWLTVVVRVCSEGQGEELLNPNERFEVSFHCFFFKMG